MPLYRHGLSYTTFKYSALSVTSDSAAFEIENTGKVAGASVSQLYISPAPTNTISRPIKELKGFAKTFLQPGEIKEVKISIDRLATSFWDEVLDSWLSEAGTYGVHIGESSDRIRLSGELIIGKTTTWKGL